MRVPTEFVATIRIRSRVPRSRSRTRWTRPVPTSVQRRPQRCQVIAKPRFSPVQRPVRATSRLPTLAVPAIDGLSRGCGMLSTAPGRRGRARPDLRCGGGHAQLGAPHRRRPARTSRPSRLRSPCTRSRDSAPTGTRLRRPTRTQRPLNASSAATDSGAGRGRPDGGEASGSRRRGARRLRQARRSACRSRTVMPGPGSTRSRQRLRMEPECA